MMFRGCTLVCLLFTAVIVLAEEPSNSANGDPSDIEKKTTTMPTTTKEISTTTQPPTSPTPSTTAAPTTLPTTPSPVPTTTPTVPTSPPTSSPAPPTTSTSAPPTPTPAPTTPSPPPSDWVVHGANNSVCIIANMAMKVSVTYLSIENKSMNAEFKIDKIENAHANGNCVGNAETLVLTTPSLNATFHFAENATAKSYALSSVDVTILVNNQTFPNHTMGNVSMIDLKHSSQVFSVPLNNSYTCEKVDTLNLIGKTANNDTVLGNLFVSKVHVEAFGNKKEAKYSSAMDCVARDTPDIVPIVVGLILAGLVVVVLLAYLVGRRRAQARGYLSM